MQRVGFSLHLADNFPAMVRRIWIILLDQEGECCYDDLLEVVMMKHIEVAAAILVQGHKVFAAQRADKGELALKWEFPGGKLEKGESGEEAIVREIFEELGIEIVANELLLTVEHQYTNFSLTMHGYLCEIIRGEPTLSEHLCCRWLGKDELYSVPWAEADLPIVKAVSFLLG